MKKFLLFAMMCVLGIFTVKAQETITIGDGTQGNYSLPTEVYYSYSFSQQSYTKAEIADAGGYAGTITSIAFRTYDSFSEGTRNLRVFMTNIDTEDEVTFDYVGNSYYQLPDLSGLVYEGAVNFVATSWNTIEFETPFVYNGNHLLVTVLDDTGSDQSDIYFDVHQKTAYDDNNNSICWATNTGNNNGTFDPTTIASSYPNGVRNNIQLTFAAAGGGGDSGDGEEPETPEVNFVATVNGQNSITLSWNAVEGATSYDIYGDASIYGLTSTTYTFEGLTAGTEYCFELVAVDADWNELETAEVCATTEAAPALPAAPTNVVATADGQNSIVLTWDAVEGATDYYVYKDGNMWANTSGATTYTENGLTAGTEYCFAVQTVADDLESELSETVCVTTEAAAVAPAAPTNLVATANGMNSIVLTWDAVEGATDYYVYKGGQMWANTSGATTYTENGLTMGTEYCFAVQAVAELESELSETVCATTESLSEDQILIGEAATADYAPFYTRYDGVWTEMIYKSSEIGQACTIGELAFSYKSGNETTSDVNIYLKEVATTEFVATDVTLPESELTLVYSGTGITLCGEAWETFVLDTPFNYSGENNLLVVVYTSNTEGVFNKWNSYEDANSVLVNVTQASYIFTNSNKPVLLLTKSEEAAPVIPAAPTNVVATAVDETSIALSWDAVEGATKYNIYWNGWILDSTTETSYEFTGWYSPGTTMCYTVTAENENGESEQSEEACATTLEPAIYTPNNFTVLATGETTIELSWSAIENAVSYNIYSGEELVANVTETSYIVENLAADTEYCYAVTAFNGEVESDRTEELCATTDKKAQEFNPEATYRLLSTENYAVTTYEYQSETTNKVAEINADGLIDYLKYDEDGKLMGAVVCYPYEDEEGNPTADTMSVIDYVYEDDVFVGYKEVVQGWGGLMTQEFEFVYNEEGQLEAVQSAGMKYLYTYNEEGLVSGMEVGYIYGEGEEAEFSVESKEVYTYENGRLATKGYYSLDWMNEGEFYLSEEALYEYDENGNCIAEKVYTIYNDEEGNEIRSLYNVTEYTYNLTISKDNAYIFEYPHLAMLDPAQPSYSNVLVKTLSYYSYIDETTGEAMEHSHVKTMYYYEEYEQEVAPEPVAPAAPTNVVATAVSTSEIVLSWNVVEGATTYGVYYNDQMLGTLDSATDTVCGFQQLTPNTEYCFTVTAFNGELESEKSEEACATTQGEGIAENTNSFNIYPNPVENQLFIETEMNVEEISVYDMFGRKLSAVSGQQSVVDVTELNSGVYFVKVVTDNGEAVQRFIKK